jgi:hypothetical protein
MWLIRVASSVNALSQLSHWHGTVSSGGAGESGREGPGSCCSSRGSSSDVSSDVALERAPKDGDGERLKPLRDMFDRTASLGLECGWCVAQGAGERALVPALGLRVPRVRLCTRLSQRFRAHKHSLSNLGTILVMNASSPPAFDGPSTPTPSSSSLKGRAPSIPYVGGKRGRKPRVGGPGSATSSPHIPTQDFKMPTGSSPSYYPTNASSQWATTPGAGPSTPSRGSTPTSVTSASNMFTSSAGGPSTISFLQNNPNPTAAQLQSRLQQLSLPNPDFAITPTRPTGMSTPGVGAVGGEDEGEDDEILPAMADDDYSAQLSWQSQTKDNLKCVSPVLMLLNRMSSRFSLGFSWITLVKTSMIASKPIVAMRFRSLA